MEYLAYSLRTISERLRLQPVEAVALQPGVRAAYRLTIRYHDRRARDSVATVVRDGPSGARLEVAFQGAFAGKPFRFQVEQTDYDAFTQGLNKLGFDKLEDQRQIPSYGVDLWLFERAAGTFYKSVIVAPALAPTTHWQLIRLAYTHVAEAVREVPTEQTG
jgi:hypothetical protein